MGGNAYADDEGRMFWLNRNMFDGSYRRLSRASRS
jgi:hypothetical protein